MRWAGAEYLNILDYYHLFLSLNHSETSLVTLEFSEKVKINILVPRTLLFKTESLNLPVTPPFLSSLCWDFQTLSLKHCFSMLLGFLCPQTVPPSVWISQLSLGKGWVLKIPIPPSFRKTAT